MSARVLYLSVSQHIQADACVFYCPPSNHINTPILCVYPNPACHFVAAAAQRSSAVQTAGAAQSRKLLQHGTAAHPRNLTVIKAPGLTAVSGKLPDNTTATSVTAPGVKVGLQVSSWFAIC